VGTTYNYTIHFLMYEVLRTFTLAFCSSRNGSEHVGTLRGRKSTAAFTCTPYTGYAHKVRSTFVLRYPVNLPPNVSCGPD